MAPTSELADLCSRWDSSISQQNYGARLASSSLTFDLVHRTHQLNATPDAGKYPPPACYHSRLQMPSRRTPTAHLPDEVLVGFVDFDPEYCVKWIEDLGKSLGAVGDLNRQNIRMASMKCKGGNEEEVESKRAKAFDMGMKLTTADFEGPPLAPENKGYQIKFL